jgi:hypothetical protein
MSISLSRLFLLSPLLDVKVTDETNLHLEKHVRLLIKELETRTVRKKLQGKSIEIIIPRNYGQTVYEYAVEEEKEHYDSYGYSESRGNFSITTEAGKINFKLIINPSVFDDYMYFSTVVHEFTHAIDFSGYINKYGNPSEMNRNLKNQNYYFEFYLWTEFNAKKIGLERLQKELDKTNLMINIAEAASAFIDEVESEETNLPRLYHLMHFLARISVCGDSSTKYNSDLYPNSYLCAKFGNNVDVIHLTMEKIKNFKDFEKEKDLLRYLLFTRQNYLF